MKMTWWKGPVSSSRAGSTSKSRRYHSALARRSVTVRARCPIRGKSATVPPPVSFPLVMGAVRRTHDVDPIPLRDRAEHVGARDGEPGRRHVAGGRLTQLEGEALEACRRGQQEHARRFDIDRERVRDASWREHEGPGLTRPGLQEVWSSTIATHCVPLSLTAVSSTSGSPGAIRPVAAKKRRTECRGIAIPPGWFTR